MYLTNPSRQFVLLLVCAFFTPLVLAMAGQETAVVLNQRVAATVDRCLGDQEIEACSGVLMRPMPDAHPREFWRHDAQAQASGYERFFLLSANGMLVSQQETNGYILHDGLTAAAIGKPLQVIGRAGNEIRLWYWDDSRPDQVPVQAIYYLTGRPGALLRAQRSQLAWFQATGQWISVLRFSIGEGSPRFGFDQREQLYNGYEVAKAINTRYAETAQACPDGRPRYYCQGVWVRTVDNDQYKAWNPVPTDFTNQQGVSFSYFAYDTANIRTYKAQGFILFASGYPVNTPIPLLCAYPFDAGTRLNRNVCSFRSTCASLGVGSVASWLARYQGTPHTSCSFGTDQQAFQVAADVRRQGVRDGYGWNELMLRAWPQNVPAQLPMEAFIYSDVIYSGSNGLVGAKKFQRQYVDETQHYLPVLRLSPAAPGGALVTYLPQDQETP